MDPRLRGDDEKGVEGGHSPSRKREGAGGVGQRSAWPIPTP